MRPGNSQTVENWVCDIIIEHHRCRRPHSYSEDLMIGDNDSETALYTIAASGHLFTLPNPLNQVAAANLRSLNPDRSHKIEWKYSSRYRPDILKAFSEKIFHVKDLTSLADSRVTLSMGLPQDLAVEHYPSLHNNG